MIDTTKISKFVIDKLGLEIALQGHKHTGSLIKSLSSKKEIIGNGIVLSFSGNFYAKFLDLGVKSSKIPFSPGSGKGKSKYITALIAYFKAKGAVNPKAAAFATARKHLKEGMPTKGSFRFSRTDKRTGFIDEMLKKNDKQIFQLLDSEIFRDHEKSIDNIIKKNKL